MPTKRNPNECLTRFLYLLAQQEIPIETVKNLAQAAENDLNIDPHLRKFFEGIALKLTPPDPRKVSIMNKNRDGERPQ